LTTVTSKENAAEHRFPASHAFPSIILVPISDAKVGAIMKVEEGIEIYAGIVLAVP
jgi:hypothetical protein